MQRPPTWLRYAGPGRLIPDAFKDADSGMMARIAGFNLDEVLEKIKESQK